MAILITTLVIIFLMTGGNVLKFLWIRIRQRMIYARISRAPHLFGSSYMESQVLYLHRFGKIPSITYVNEVDLAKAQEYINEHMKDSILDVFQTSWFDREKDQQLASKTLMVLRNRVILELSRDYVEICYDTASYRYADDLLRTLSTYRLPQKKEPFEINIITSGADGLELKSLEIKPTTLDIGLFYNDDFGEVDALVRQRLQSENDKGIVLFHGLPGTGKTTYLRHLIGGMKKKVLFVSPSVAVNLMNPDFIDLLISYPNAVLVIEDAENIIMDRKINSYSSVSNLLNLSDGLLSDCLNVQIICTFNSALSLVDEALLRKGRLIARYEFGKLHVSKAQKLSDHLGMNQRITKPMTLAEITNPAQVSFAAPQVNVVGFRRELEMS